MYTDSELGDYHKELGPELAQELKDWSEKNGIDWTNKEMKEWSEQNGYPYEIDYAGMMGTIQDAIVNSDTALLRQYEEEAPGIIDFVKQIHHQRGFTIDPEASQWAMATHEEYPIRKMMPGEQPGDPSPIPDSPIYPYSWEPEQNYGHPPDGAPREEWAAYDKRKERAFELEEQRRRNTPTALGSDEIWDNLNNIDARRT